MSATSTVNDQPEMSVITKNERQVVKMGNLQLLVEEILLFRYKTAT